MTTNHFSVKKSFTKGTISFSYFSLPELERKGIGPVSRLPYSLRILLESMVRNFDGQAIQEKDVRALANWQPKGTPRTELPFKPARVILQDFSGVPCIVDLAAMRTIIQRLGGDPLKIEPQIPADLVIDHSVQVDFNATSDAVEKNMALESERNDERYRFMKWGQSAFTKLRVVPPGVGIIHQINLEYLAKGIFHDDSLVYPDSCVGTDSHTTMINGLGIVGWGVGGIEAEAVMLGQPLTMLTPDVIGVNLVGAPLKGVTATDIALAVTQTLRKKGVVGKFIEFFGPGITCLTLPDRATIANMCPEYGATIGIFPMDDETIRFLRRTGRDEKLVSTVEHYYKEQGLFWTASSPVPNYSETIEFDLGSFKPSLAGPKRPQDRVELGLVKQNFRELLSTGFDKGGYNLREDQLQMKVKIDGRGSATLTNGSLLIAAITSCTNTSNPSVMLAAGILAKKAVERELRTAPLVKTSLAPGSRVVDEYLNNTGLMPYLEKLGFHTVGFGCTTCIGNSGPIADDIARTVGENPELVTASVLSGNRNFEGRIHPLLKANYLASPPLVVAYAIVGRIDIDLTKEPLGKNDAGEAIYLSDIWPTDEELKAVIDSAFDPATFAKVYSDVNRYNDSWARIDVAPTPLYPWDSSSTYIQEPPFFSDFSPVVAKLKSITNARVLAFLGDSVTTDHISPAGSFLPSSPAGQYLTARGVAKEDFNSYGARRGNDQVMVRGTFANVRLKNKLVPGVEGGVTVYFPTMERMSIFDAAMKYKNDGTPLIVIAGKEYGTGSSRDWAAKGAYLLGIKVVIAESFERIHRSNLVGMGILPLQFKQGQSALSLGLTGSETYTIAIDDSLSAAQEVKVSAKGQDGKNLVFTTINRIDTPVEIGYLKNGGILQTVLRELIG